MSENLSKKLGLTKKLTVRMIDDDSADVLKVPASLSNRRQTQNKKVLKLGGQNYAPLDIQGVESLDNSRSQSYNQNNTIDYQGDNSIKVSEGKIVVSEPDSIVHEPTFKDEKPFVSQGSVWIKQTGATPSIEKDHVDSILRQSQQNVEGLIDRSGSQGEAQQVDQFYAAQKIKMVFKRATFDGFFNKCWLIVELPLNVLRDYTCPMSEYADWNRTRASVLPLTFVWGLFYLQGKFEPGEEEEDGENADGLFYLKIASYTMIPMVIIAIYIRFYTKVTEPPTKIMFLFAIISFINSISWIGFTCDIVVDILTILGQILSVPKSLLGFTLLAWGNCLGDMQANVAMTKKGFGEMAITGCMAGPIFNILMGLGLATIGALISDDEHDGKHD